MLFDMMPIRREMIQQLVGSSEEWQKLSPEERQKVIGEVNQRMLGIVQGIQLGAAELQKKVSEAQQPGRREGARGRNGGRRQAGRRGSQPRCRRSRQSCTRGHPRQRRRRRMPRRPPPERQVRRGARSLSPAPPGRHGRAERHRSFARRTPRSTCRTCSRPCSRPPAASAGRFRSRSARTAASIRRPSDDRTKDRIARRRRVTAEAPTGTTVLPDWIVVTTADPPAPASSSASRVRSASRSTICAARRPAMPVSVWRASAWP